MQIILSRMKRTHINEGGGQEPRAQADNEPHPQINKIQRSEGALLQRRWLQIWPAPPSLQKPQSLQDPQTRKPGKPDTPHKYRMHCTIKQMPLRGLTSLHWLARPAHEDAAGAAGANAGRSQQASSTCACGSMKRWL